MKLIFNQGQWVLTIVLCLTAFFSKIDVLAEKNNSLSSNPELDGEISEICPADLPSAIANIVDSPLFKRSRWGIEIQTLDNRQALYSLNGDKFFTPASSLKLLTTAAVLSELGANYRIVTPISIEGNLPNISTLELIGQGDPTISTQSIKRIVHELQGLGIQRIEKLIIDDSYFTYPAINPTWEWLDVHSYFATGVNSAILNQNTVTLTLLPQQLGEPVKYYWSDRIAGKQWQVINQGITGEKDLPYNIHIDGDLGKPLLKIRGELAINESPDIWDLAVVEPSYYFLESLRLYLEQAGIKVTQGIVINQSQSSKMDEPILKIISPSVAEIIQEINQESNNLYAEAIARVLGKKLQTASETEAITDSLEKLGINPEEYVLIDASGLSRQNLVTPQTLVKTLHIIASLPPITSQAYRQSLALAGINGTLKYRFRNSKVRERFWGKTGTLTGVGSLSGYLYPSNYSPLAISIIVNNSELSSKEIRQAIDRIVMVLNHIQQC